MKLVAFLFLIVQVSFGQISKNTIEKKFQLYHFNLEKCHYCVLLDKLTLNQPVFKSYIDSSNYQLIHVDRLHSKTQEKLKKKFKIKLYPAMVVYDSSNDIVYDKIVGYIAKDSLISKLKNVTDSNSLNYFEKNYSNNKTNPIFLYNYVKKQDLGYHVDSVLVNEYIATQSDTELYSEKNIRFIFDYIQYFSYTKLSVKSKAFKFMYNNRDLFAPYYKKDQVEVKLIFTIFDELNKNIEEKDSISFYENSKYLDFYDESKRYKYFVQDTIMIGKTYLYAFTKLKLLLNDKMNDSAHFEENAKVLDVNLLNDSEELNDFAWDIYENYNSSFAIQKGIQYIKHSIELNKSYEAMDTYASLLFKSKNYPLAKKVALEAINQAKKEQKPFKETVSLLSKIRKKLK
jgi:hypothetical protein